MLRTIVTTCIMGYAAYSDIKSREVDDTVWVLFILAAAGFVLAELGFLDKVQLLLFFISGYAAFVVGLSMTAFNLMGYADFLALACLSLATPPSSTAFSKPGFAMLPSLSIFINALLVSFLYPVALLARNLYLLRKGVDLFEGVEVSPAGKLLALFTLTRVPTREFLRKRHAYALAEKDVGGRRKLAFWGRVKGVQPQGDWVWVSPYTPFIAMLAAGYVIHLLYGCILDPLFVP